MLLCRAAEPGQPHTAGLGPTAHTWHSHQHTRNAQGCLILAIPAFRSGTPKGKSEPRMPWLQPSSLSHPAQVLSALVLNDSSSFQTFGPPATRASSWAVIPWDFSSLEYTEHLFFTCLCTISNSEHLHSPCQPAIPGTPHMNSSTSDQPYQTPLCLQFHHILLSNQYCFIIKPGLHF